MRVEYSVTTWDLLRAMLLIRPLQRFTATFALVLLALTLWFQWSLGKSEGTQIDWMRTIANDVLVIGLLFGVVFAVLVIAYALQVRFVPGVLGVHCLEIRDDGLFEETHANQTLTRWTVIRQVQRTRSMAVIALSWWMFHVVPRRAFSAPASFEAFCAELENRIRRMPNKAVDLTPGSTSQNLGGSPES